jgi:hypothetical protein
VSLQLQGGYEPPRGRSVPVSRSTVPTGAPPTRGVPTSRPPISPLWPDPPPRNGPPPRWDRQPPPSRRSLRETERRRGRRGRRGRVVGRLVTTLSAVLVLFCLLTPNQLSRLTPGAFLRIPAEALVLVALALALPRRVRGVVAGLVGALLGVVTLGKALDMGFLQFLYRPFDPMSDVTFLSNGVEFLTTSMGRGGAMGVVVGAAVGALVLVTLTTLSMLRLSHEVARRARPSAVVAGALAVVWGLTAVIGVQAAPGEPFAARETFGASVDRARQIAASVHDQQTFAAQLAADRIHDTPGTQLLTALRGKDVVLAFVESYGEVALEDPEFGPRTTAVLDDGDRRLRAAGFASRSAWLTSPTFGGGSWLAQSTLLSGVWTSNQQQYNELVSSDRTTLNGAFKRAGWQTVGVVPGVIRDWPESKFFHLDRFYDAKHLGYKGPRFTWSPMPDQYTLAQFQKLERSKAKRGPIMAEIPLTSSHIPWSPLPKMIDWNAVGDGSVYKSMAVTSETQQSVLRNSARARAGYGQSIQYSLSSLISYIEKYGDPNLVVVFLGDHQPSPIVTGSGAGRDVPITVVAKDPKVMDRIADWKWDAGLRPRDKAPVWRMDTFRDRFLTAFSGR